MARRPEKVPESPPPKGFPRQIRICGQRWSVRYVSMADHGECQDAERTILVRSDLAPDALADVLLHETLHACLLTVSRKHEESVVEKLTPVLMDFLRSNRAWW